MNGRKKLVVILILLALIAVITLAGSSLFGNVTVEFRSENTMQYTYSQLLSYSGIPNDANILKLDTELIKANIESNCNYLVEVKNIERIFPNKVVITVKERSEYAMLEYGPDAYVTLDKKGNMIHCLTNNPNLILIKGAGAIRQFEPGEMMMSQQPELMEAAIKVYSTVYDVQMSASVLTVNVENVNAIRLELTGGYEAILGNTDELHEKLTKLNILLQKYKNENNPKGTFNVSVPDYPVFSENNQ